MDRMVVTVWQDIACPWATLALYRLRRARKRLGLQGSVAIDLKAFPLELVNERPTPKRVLDAEMPVAGALEPDLGWRMWQRRDSEWPVTTLPALEAVYAAKQQSLQVAERLDAGLRDALFRDSRTISMHDEIVRVASQTEGLDVPALERALEDGTCRRDVFADHRIAGSTDVKGSPHLFMPDATDFHNPGIELHWTGEHGEGFPIVDKDDPAIYETLLVQATADNAHGRTEHG